MTEYRVEKDSLGEVNVPANAYYAAQTQRAVENFPVRTPPDRGTLQISPTPRRGTIFSTKPARSFWEKRL